MTEELSPRHLLRRQGQRLSPRARTRQDAREFPHLFTAAEVAILLRTSRKAIYAMTERGQLPGVTRIGRRVLYRRDDLLRWLEESRAPSPREDWR